MSHTLKTVILSALFILLCLEFGPVPDANHRLRPRPPEVEVSVMWATSGSCRGHASTLSTRIRQFQWIARCFGAP